MRAGGFPCEIERREMLRVASALAAGLAAFATLPGCPDDAKLPGVPGPGGGADDANAADSGSGVADLPTLGGAPDTPVGRVIAAFCDTVVPGRHRDPTGAPGAIDVGVPGFLMDPSLPFGLYLGLLRWVLDAETGKLFPERTFDQIAPADREQVLEAAVKSLDILELALQIVRLGYFSSRAAGDHLGYPGPNTGYVADADFSFRKPMSKEIAKDGTLP